MFIVPIEPIQLGSIGSIQSIGGLGDTQGAGEKKSTLDAVPFANVLQDAMAGYADAKKVTDADSVSLALGDVDNLAQLQINSMKAQSMLSTTVQLTTRMVNAYKEIMQMQI